ASGFFSGGSGLGLSEPGSIGSIKCFSCATAELAAARKRTASRQMTARISNYTPYGPVGNENPKCNHAQTSKLEDSPKTIPLFDHRGGGGEHLIRHGEAERAFAVLRLTASSNFTVCCTGRSAGFSPLRMRPA